MSQRIFTDESLATFVNEIKAYTDSAITNADEVYIGTTVPTDPNIQIWINIGEDEVEAIASSQIQVSSVSLVATNWTGSGTMWTQVVNISGVTANSRIDLQPSPEQLAIFHEKDVAFTAVNEDGVVTVYAIGVKPTQNYVIQCTITEVIVNG